jgi:hypothetical protein
MGSSDACPNDDAVESELIVVDGQRVGAVHDRMARATRSGMHMISVEACRE